ncbi:MAG TPA: glycosyltransferase family 39 protein [Vicinamibacterales bacterium]|nr:glycosyltransferase family 39 protein [Vicinamibacterales bacterium]HOQ59704.1 glycosyltransferase family 39 protein [Vicinamibacterales bacterium]HPK70729.1 glycosyltransferase family 39 protein [Vicinamibacterales bacterium]
MPADPPRQIAPLPAAWAPACVVLPLATLVFQLLTHRGYGFFRDELYYLASAEHLGLGYVEHPPMIALVAWLVRSALGDSLLAARLLPAVAHGALVALAAMLAREMGGGRRAQLLAALATAVAPAYVGLCGILSMNAFDLVFWTALWLVAARALRTGDTRWWLWFGVIAGAGLQNKISVLFLGFGTVAGLAVTRRWRVLRSRHLWVGGAVAALVFLPHLVWQWQNGWPTLEFIANATREKNVALSPGAFLGEQVGTMGALAAPLWIGGLAGLLAARRLGTFRPLGWAYPVVLAVMLASNSKPYYLTPAYTVLFAAGAVLVEGIRWSRVRSIAAPALAVMIALGGAMSLPLVKPVLSTDAFLRYSAAIGQTPRPEERHEMGRLPQMYADMHGWPELAANLATVYHALPARDRERACIFVRNYGEAGAVDVLGAPLGLPRAISGHNSYFLWGPRGCTGDLVIALGAGRGDYEEAFASVEQAGVHTCTDCMPYENNLSIWVLRGARVPFAAYWPRVKRYI